MTPEQKAEGLIKQVMPWGFAIFLSCWGGFVSHVQRNRGRKMRIKILIFDLAISSFAGILTHLLCQSAGLNPTLSAALVAISGHMGTRAISSFELLHDRFLGKLQ